MSTESDKSPNGVCSFVVLFGFSRFLHPQWGLQFCCFLFFEVFAWFALLYTVVITSNCPSLCEIHVEPFKTLQNQNFHIPPPHPPALLKNPTAPGIPGSNHNEPQQPPPKTVAAPQPGSTRAMETGRLYGDRDAYKAMSFDRENPVCDGLSGLWQGAARVQIPFEEVRRGSEPRPLGALGQFHAKKERR